MENWLKRFEGRTIKKIEMHFVAKNCPDEIKIIFTDDSEITLTADNFWTIVQIYEKIILEEPEEEIKIYSILNRETRYSLIRGFFTDLNEAINYFKNNLSSFERRTYGVYCKNELVYPKEK